MGKPLYNLLLVFVACTVCLPMSLADNSCPVVHGKRCNKDKDIEIMRCCLKSYKEGFDSLRPPNKLQRRQNDPPTCRIDLGLAECLSRSNCFADVTNALRILILNQLVFTNHVGICKQNKFDHLLEEAERGFSRPSEDLELLKNVTEMEGMEAEACATYVYGICGLAFIKQLQEKPGFNAAELCTVFINEADCIDKTKIELHCTESEVLKRFKQNSDKAGSIVLHALCSLSPKN